MEPSYSFSCVNDLIYITIIAQKRVWIGLHAPCHVRFDAVGQCRGHCRRASINQISRGL